MVVTQKKPFEEVLQMLQGCEKIIITGCSECATVCKTGGADELLQMRLALEAAGKEVLDTVVLTTSCNVLYDRKELKTLRPALDQADAILCLACGDGVQTVAKVSKKPVYPGNNTLFVGETVRNGLFLERCKTCGQCVLGRTAAICPVTACGKSLLDGPCGGARDGHCEVNADNKCAWIEIYEKLSAQGREDLLEMDVPLRSYAGNVHPRTINLREISGGELL